MTKFERYEIAMKHAKKFAAKSASRPVLAGAHHAPNGEVHVTDSHRLMVVKDVHSFTEPITLHADTKAPIDGTYPDISRILPDKFKTEITLYGKIAHAKDTLDDWINAVKVAIAIGDRKQPIATFTVGNNGIKLSAKNERGQYEHNLISDTVTGEEVTLAFNAKYLLDALNLLKDFNANKVTLGFNGANSPFTFETDNGVIALIVPIRSY